VFAAARSVAGFPGATTRPAGYEVGGGGISVCGRSAPTEIFADAEEVLSTDLAACVPQPGRRKRLVDAWRRERADRSGPAASVEQRTHRDHDERRNGDEQQNEEPSLADSAPFCESCGCRAVLQPDFQGSRSRWV